MRKSKFIVFGFVTLALIITLSMFTSVLDNYKEQNKNTVIAVQNVASMGYSKTSIKDYLNIADTYDGAKETAFSCELPEEEVYETKITPVLVNGNFFSYSNISLEGEGLTEVMEKAKERTAVISRTFAKDHFYGDTAIGKTFKIQNLRYRVTGIYDDKNDSLNNLFKDGKERIYINYTGIDKYEKVKLTSMLCSSGSDIARIFPKIGFENFERIDFTEKNMAVNDFTVILSFIITVVISIYLIRLWIYSLSSTIGFVRKKTETQYVLGFLKKNTPAILLRLFILIAIPAGIFFLFMLCFRNFHIVERYIDKDNLFSVSHMIEQLGITLQRESETLFAGNTFPMSLYNGTLIILSILTPVISVLFFFTLYTGISVVKESNIAKFILIAVFILISVISMIISLISGSGYAFFEIISLISGVFLLSFITSVVKKLCN